MKKLAALLVALLVVGVGRTGEKDLLERLKKAEASAFTAPEQDGEEALGVQLDPQSIDVVLPELCELRCLRLLILKCPNLTDAQMQTACDLTSMSGLQLDGCPVTESPTKALLS
jgi:hypothetical protein